MQSPTSSKRIVTALVLSLTAWLGACSEGVTNLPPVAEPGSIEILSGDDQQAAPGQTLPEPLVVRVLDKSGSPLPDQGVRFTVLSGGGTVAGGVAITDADGLAQERWTVGPDTTAPQTLEIVAARTSAQGRAEASTTVHAYAKKASNPGDLEPPSVPQNLVAQPVSSSTVNLGWSAATDNVGVSSYRVFRDGNVVGTTSDITYSDAALSANTAYAYAVSAIDAAGNESARSVSVSVTTGAATPGSGTTVGLNLVRMDGGSGTALVSSGIPLPAGTLMASELNHVRLIVGGQEQPIYVEALEGRHQDGSVRSILVQLSYGVSAGAPVGATLIIDQTATRTTADRAKTAVAYSYSAPVPQAVALPVSAEYLISSGIVGESVPIPDSFGAAHESKFVTVGDGKWQIMESEYGTSLTVDAAIVRNYYDRALIHWAWWARTGQAEYWRRAVHYLMAYRELYMRPNDYKVQPHNIQIEGLELHYLLTGDAESRNGVARAAAYYTSAWLPHLGNRDHNYLEGRIQARTLRGLMTAYRLGITTHDYAALSRQALTAILGTQSADGSYTFNNTCYTQFNYMTGLVNDVFIAYYTYFEADQRIPPAIKKALDYMWNTQWRADAGGFNYASGECEGKGGPSASADLNLLIVTGFGWYARHSGVASYRSNGDVIFTNGVEKAWLGSTPAQGDKQFNENYRSAHRYLRYRQW